MQCKLIRYKIPAIWSARLTPKTPHFLWLRFIYNVSVRSGKFELFRRWMISNTPADKRIMLLIIGYSFGALLEGTRTSSLRQDAHTVNRIIMLNPNPFLYLLPGVAGFGTPGAICSSLLVSLGWVKENWLVYDMKLNVSIFWFHQTQSALALTLSMHWLTLLSSIPLPSRLVPLVSQSQPWLHWLVYLSRLCRKWLVDSFHLSLCFCPHMHFCFMPVGEMAS